MQADTSLREVGRWETFLMITSNRSLTDLLTLNNDTTDSGLQRLFEIFLPKINQPFSTSAGPILKQTETNYGHAGRMYAKWLAMNLPEAQAAVMQTLAALSKMVNAQQEERLLITGMAAMLTGAMIGKKLDFMDFDLPGIRDVLLRSFQEQRGQRGTKTLVLPQGGLDLEELLGRYLNQEADYRLRTDRIPTVGKPTHKITPTAMPRFNIVRYQIAEQDALLRIDRHALTKWLITGNMPAADVVKQLIDKFNGVARRATLGGGTHLAGGQVQVIDIPLVGPLAHYATPPDPVSKPAPDVPPPGNQPKL